jgi:ribonuclease HI
MNDFEKLAEELGVKKFDLMLAGDGSGMTRKEACGWHCNCYYKPGGLIKEVFGGASSGTNNYAELVPYVHALWHFHSAWVERFPGRKPDLTVLVVSDSELTVRCGNREYQRKANLALWAAVDWFEQNGYRFVWKHVPRNSNPLGKRSDKLAGEARGLFQTKSKCQTGPGPSGSGSEC